MRAFIAIDIPRDIKNRIGGLIKECKAVGNAPVKYVETENMHITVKFLGDIENSILKTLSNELGKISCPAPGLSIFSAGAFPGFDFARIVWVGIKENTDLNSVFLEIEKISEKNGFPAEQRGFNPHITVARVKGRVGNEWIGAVKKYEGFEFGSYKPEGFSIYRSDLDQKGPVYTKIAFFPFKEVPHGL